ncbi:MAG: hypothetical protein ACAH95_12975, partial [Fimbriimonas sp.]
MSSSPITIPLHSKSDRYGLPLIIVFFLSVPVWALVEGSFLTAALTALFIGGYVWWLFRFVPSVLGASAEIDDRRLRLVRRGKVLWACEWSEIEDVLIPNFVSAAEEMHFVLRNQTKPNILRNVLGHLPRAELKEAIRRRLPAGVQIRNRVLGFRPSRSRYLIVGLIGSIG